MEHEIQIRRLAPDEGSLLKELRLAALSESPEAFGETLAEATARDAHWWARLTESLTDIGPHAGFIAERGEQTVGLIFGIVDKEEPSIARVGGMWVAPQARRAGVGAGLLGAVTEWARAQGKTELALWAPAAAEPARALFEASGFAATGSAREVGEHMRILELRRPLA